METPVCLRLHPPGRLWRAEGAGGQPLLCRGDHRLRCCGGRRRAIRTDWRCDRLCKTSRLSLSAKAVVHDRVGGGSGLLFVAMAAVLVRWVEPKAAFRTKMLDLFP